MTLVSYSDSDDEDTREDLSSISPAPSSSLKRKNESIEEDNHRAKPPPSLPSSFLRLYATNARTSTNDDPSLHGGRQRQVPHIEGNWPSFAYLEWFPSEQDLATLEGVIKASSHRGVDEPVAADEQVKFHSFLRSDLNVRQPLHVSLTSPLILTTANKDKLETCLVKAVRAASICSFSVSYSDLRWVSNFDESRHFLILVLTQPKNDELNTLLKLCNRVCQDFDLPQLYTDKKLVGVPKHPRGGDKAVTPTQELVAATDKFHISIGWTLQKPHANLHDSLLIQPESELRIAFDGLHIKIGNHISKVLFEKQDRENIKETPG